LELAHTKLITTQYQLFTRFSEAHFFEFKFTNPFLKETTFEVRFRDQDLRIIQDLEEWSLFKSLHNVSGGSLEQDLVAKRSQDNIYHIWLRGTETVTIPFVYQRWSLNDTDEKISKVRAHMEYHF
jgi:hypothetical protein